MSLLLQDSDYRHLLGRALFGLFLSFGLAYTDAGGCKLRFSFKYCTNSVFFLTPSLGSFEFTDCLMNFAGSYLKPDRLLYRHLKHLGLLLKQTGPQLRVKRFSWGHKISFTSTNCQLSSVETFPLTPPPSWDFLLLAMVFVFLP